MSGNSYVGASPELQERIEEFASKALELQIRNAITHLTQGQTGRYTQVIALLEELIGEGE